MYTKGVHIKDVFIQVRSAAAHAWGASRAKGVCITEWHGCHTGVALSLQNGDDSITIKSGSSDVLVEDCIFQDGHGAKGGGTSARNAL